MVYQGSKRRLAKELKPIIEQYLKAQKTNTGSAYYVEPFVGGANMIINIDSNYTRVGYDINKVVIELLNRAKNGELQKMYDAKVHEYWVENKEETYNYWKHYKEVDKQYREGKIDLDNEYLFKLGIYGYILSWSSKYFTSFVLNSVGAPQKVESTLRNIAKQGTQLKGITLINRSYQDVTIGEGAVVYCDPPYVNTSNAAYSKSCDFSIEEFEKKCKEWHDAGAVVLLSELTKYSDNWQEIWSKKIMHGLVSDQRKEVTEKLFIYVPQN